ncbi:hypothetical protein EDC04DRAFT_3089339 [Pisolithus marmoratus]|nr:hypothetical protein EDC04DRAFT_3089339 [Pisolithus marmoratus]
MYIRASTLLFPVFALASLVAAAPGDIEARGAAAARAPPALSCAVHRPSLWCRADSIPLGVTVDPVIGPLLAIGCTAFVGSCTAQTTCCQSGQSDNLVYVGCNNIAV